MTFHRFGILHALLNLVLTYLVISSIHPFFPEKLNQTERLLLSMLVNMQDDSGYKLIDTNNKNFDAFSKGTSMINLIMSVSIGFSITKDYNAMHSGHVNIPMELGMLGITIGSSLVLSLMFGVITSFLFANCSSIRQSSINEILYILFCTYLIAAIGFFDETWDFNSEELVVIFFGIFSSHYTRYNLRLESASRLR